MPTVPKPQRQVQLQQLPDVRLTAAETPESLGAGIAEAQGDEGRALAGVGAKATALGEQVYGDVVEKEKRRADQVAVLSADTQLAQWENKRIYDPTSGALTVKGKDAMALPEQIRDEYNTQADAVAASLSTPEQKAAFLKIRSERGINLDATISRHTLAEIQQYQGQELQASLDNSRNAAIANSDDPRRVGIELARQTDAIQTHAKDLGFGPEEIQKQVAAATSATHVGVLEKMLAEEKTTAAQVYFEEARSQINGDQIARIEKALHEGSVRKQGQQKADEIVQAGGTLSQQRDAAKKIDDPDVRDQVTQRIEHEYSIAQEQKRADDEAAAKAAYNILDATKDVNKIPPTAWRSFTGGERASMRAYADKLAKGEAVDTDFPTYYGLMGKAGTDPTSFANENLLGYRAKLGDAEFKQLTELQLSIRNKEANAFDKNAPGFRDREQILNDTLTQYGIDPKAKPDTDEGKSIAQLRRMLDQRVEAAQTGGKKVSNTEIQQTLDGILGQNVTTPGSWWGTWFGHTFFGNTQKRLLDVTASDIPTAERATLERALRDSGRTVTDQTVLDTYLNVLVRRNYRAGK